MSDDIEAEIVSLVAPALARDEAWAQRWLEVRLAEQQRVSAQARAGRRPLPPSAVAGEHEVTRVLEVADRLRGPARGSNHPQMLQEQDQGRGRRDRNNDDTNNDGGGAVPTTASSLTVRLVRSAINYLLGFSPNGGGGSDNNDDDGDDVPASIPVDMRILRLASELADLCLPLAALMRGTAGKAAERAPPAPPATPPPTCVLCLSAPSDAGLLHGSTLHRCLCRGCARRHISPAAAGHGAPHESPPRSGCPVCRARVERVVDIF